MALTVTVFIDNNEHFNLSECAPVIVISRTDYTGKHHLVINKILKVCNVH
jgi:hypothetical protein